MNDTARVIRARLRTAALAAAVLSGAGLLLTACSSTSPSMSGGGTAAAPAERGAPRPAPKALGRSTATVARLAGPQSIIFTASLTVRARNVTAAAATAARLVTAGGGYVSDEQQTITPGSPASVSMELKIPSALYATTFTALQTRLGTKLSLNQRAEDVTQQVADVGSRVASAQAAIRQLRALLSRAGSVGSLLAVQDEINSQEAALEALLAQQRALAHETSYATVSLLLLGHHARAVVHHRKSGGFGGGLTAGWHALKTVITALLTALGAALPFIVLVALLGGIGYGGWRRLGRKRAAAAAATPPAAP